MIKEYMSEKDLSKFLNISLTSLWRLRKENKIPYIRIGKTIRYEKNAIIKWLKINSF
ncbi:TPA: helix-turn-helix domain-containing protein [Campylobacter jejuni]|nr:helix-turn-helix domain-containing protein [Campylobacter jejuni]HEC1884099.1 helix-turn-helix domain-containing protein [Campylobacter jejuni]